MLASCELMRKYLKAKNNKNEIKKYSKINNKRVKEKKENK